MTSGIINLSVLHELNKTCELYKILDTKSPEGKKYKHLSKDLVSSVVTQPGFYL